MTDLDLLLTQYQAWENHTFGGECFTFDLLAVDDREYVSAFLDSWHSAYDLERRAEG